MGGGLVGQAAWSTIAANAVLQARLLIHAFFNLNRVCKTGTPMPLFLTYLVPEAASSFWFMSVENPRHFIYEYDTYIKIYYFRLQVRCHRLLAARARRLRGTSVGGGQAAARDRGGRGGQAPEAFGRAVTCAAAISTEC